MDFLWLGIIASDFIMGQLEPLLLENIKYGVAAGFYALYCAGIVIFAVNPALKVDKLSAAIIKGALFGFFAYATYDLTNYATLKNWPAALVPVDIIWGAVITGSSAAAGYLAARRFV